MKTPRYREAPCGTDPDCPVELPHARLITSARADSGQLQAFKGLRRELRGLARRAFFSSRCASCQRGIRRGRLILAVSPRPDLQAWLHIDCAARWYLARDAARKTP